jgi:hypothetical protein
MAGPLLVSQVMFTRSSSSRMSAMDGRPRRHLRTSGAVASSVDQPDSVRSYWACAAGGTRCLGGRSGSAGGHHPGGAHDLRHSPHWPPRRPDDCLQQFLDHDFGCDSCQPRSLLSTESLAMGPTGRRCPRRCCRWYLDVPFLAAPDSVARQSRSASCPDHFSLRGVAPSAMHADPDWPEGCVETAMRTAPGPYRRGCRRR